MHDALQIVEHQKIIVISARRDRSSLSELQQKFEKLRVKCESDVDYCVKPVPKNALPDIEAGLENLSLG